MTIDESRREALQKLLVGAGIGLGAPIITTIGSGAAAAVVSSGPTRFQLTRTASPQVSSGVLTAVAPTTSTCIPAAWAGATDSTLASPTPSGSVTAGSLPASPNGTYQVTYGFTITLPTTCAFASTADASARISILGEKQSLSGSPDTARDECKNLVVTSISPANTATGSVTFTEVRGPGNGNTFVTYRVTARIAAACTASP